MHSFDAPGMWWLPSGPERAVAGTLGYVSHGQGSLDLLGSWDDDEPVVRLSADPASMSEDALAEIELQVQQHLALVASGSGEATGADAAHEDNFPLRYPVVHGVVNGGLITLLEVQEVSRDASSVPGFPRSGFAVGAVLRGAHVGGWDHEAWTSIRVGFEHLANWCGLALLDPDATRDADASPLGKELTLICELPGGQELRLRYRSGGSYSLDERRHWREPEFAVHSRTPLSLAQVLGDVVAPLRDLLTTATGIPSALTRFELSGDHATWDSLPLPVEVGLADHRPLPDGRSLHPAQVALPLADVDYTTFIPAWFRVRDVSAVAAQFAYVQRYHRMPYGEEMLVTATAAAEALHGSLGLSGRTELSERADAVRTFVEAFPEDERELLAQRLRSINAPSLRTRLSDLVGYAGDLFAQVAVESAVWVKRVLDARNDVAHGNAKREDPPQLLALAAGCGHLVELCLLVQAGADTAKLHARLPRSPRHAELLDLSRRFLT